MSHAFANDLPGLPPRLKLPLLVYYERDGRDIYNLSTKVTQDQFMEHVARMDSAGRHSDMAQRMKYANALFLQAGGNSATQSLSDMFGDEGSQQGV